MSKVLKGILSMGIFYIFNLFIMQTIGQFIFVGDSVNISYHLFTYIGLMTLCAVIIVCTSIVIDKLNEVKKEINKSKSE